MPLPAKRNHLAARLPVLAFTYQTLTAFASVGRRQLCEEEAPMSHRLLILGCRTMRDGVVVSAIFFAGAVLLFLAATHVVPAIAYVQQIVLFLALVMIILAPVILISTFLVSVLPGAREKLDKCDH
ncbi:MAG: hypothetical protein WBM40_01910 [Thiohalocapsa sp.]